ncbi:MAG: glucokinase [Methylococcales bacterium]|nr:glucokinase [Methylococcales bacterium]
MILAGDIGGTKTLLAIFDDGLCIAKHKFSSANYATFHELLSEFLSLIPTVKIDAVCIGVAGAIVDGDCETTNLPWKLVCREIGELVNCSNVKLLNDLEAAAWGILSLPENEFVSLNPNAKAQIGTIAVLAAGTGLGEAIIFHDGEKHHVMASEGGHCDFAPTDTEQMQLLEFMQARFPQHVSYERLVSGAGIEAIHEFLEESNVHHLTYQIETELNATSDKAAVIGAAAVENNDELCVATMQLFSKIYGAEAGNLALKCLPTGGVYLAGGIAAKCLPVLQQGAFLEGFLAKGRFRATLEKFPVNVCTQPEVVLLGTLHYATINRL